MKSTITFGGALIRVMLVALAVFVPAMALFSGPSPAPKAAPRSTASERHCLPVGGTVMTNFGAIDANTTMGIATGDLRGAVSGTLLGPPQLVSGTVVFHVQHHWVTESGDMLTFDPAVATTAPISQTLFAVITYPVHVTGGTGKFAGATGDITNIGEADLIAGTVFRYSGQVCFAE
ncbi:MAG: hypothetical protein DMG54_07225 [Acidobacteria bacterium]|nr:MAG: hypothetical protein DMG53_28770 [Acidobacteriota bacterium]PYU45071.1 MAG: hypothetical protein DMG54_07225 [Acidobacteriota bacterium]PYU76158.1 MAG: hypothetical protein DMG52_05560 [Acidobacteriota bacterium]